MRVGLMKIQGKVFIDEDELGTFVVDSDSQVVVEFNGGRWSADWVFQWAKEQGRTLTFVPQDHDLSTVEAE